MCRLVAWVSETPRTLADVLGETALSRLRHLSTVHADGWGAAWHDDAGELVVQHSSAAAGADEAFTAFSEGMSSRACLVHLRLGTPGYGYGASSIHPFVDGPWAFGHNGAILPGSAIDGILEATSERRPLGPTDSERYFLAVRNEMDRPGASVAGAVAAVASRITEVGLSTSSLNSLLLGPDALYVVSVHDPGWQVGDIPVWPADLLAREAALPAYFPRSSRVDDSSVCAVSSGIVDDTGEWSAIPNDAVLRIDTRTLDTSIETLGDELAAAHV
jgi:predicted glutamine amidotransferase